MEKTFNYIILLKKSDVIDLYKFGYIYAYTPTLSFDGDMDTLTKDTKKANALFKNANPFEYSIEYYLVQLKSDKKLSKKVSIDKVVNIYALDNDSFRVGLSLDPPIRLKEPFWQEAYDKFQINLFINNAKEGIGNLFEALSVTFDVKRKGFITNKDIQTIFSLSYHGERPNGKLSIWTYLLMYERHHNYPKDMRGFFLDALHAYANFIQGKEIDAPVSKSHLGSQLMQLNETSSFKEILSVIESNKSVSSVNKVFKDYFCVAALFQKLKKDFEDGMVYGKSYYGKPLSELYNTLKPFGEENVKLSLYLLGLTLGWDNTYKYIYQLHSLPFLSKQDIK